MVEFQETYLQLPGASRIATLGQTPFQGRSYASVTKLAVTGWFFLQSIQTAGWMEVFKLFTLAGCGGCSDGVNSFCRVPGLFYYTPGTYFHSTTEDVVVGATCQQFTNFTHDIMGKWYFMAVYYNSASTTSLHCFFSFGGSPSCSSVDYGVTQRLWSTASATDNWIRLGYDTYSSGVTSKYKDFRVFPNVAFTSTSILAVAAQINNNCLPDCSSCSGPEVCSACSSGFYLVGGVCLACSGACKTCSGPTRFDCASCEAGKYLMSDGVCVKECPTTFAVSGSSCAGTQANLLYYKFLALSQRVKDEEGRCDASRGVLAEAVDSRDPTPAYKRGIYFDGQDVLPILSAAGDTLLVPPPSFTMETWVRPQAPSGTVFAGWKATSESFYSAPPLLKVTLAGKLTLFMYQKTQLTSFFSLSQEVWHYVVMTVNHKGAHEVCFLGDALQTCAIMDFALYEPFSTAVRYGVGYTELGTGSFGDQFKGFMFSFRLLNYYLSPATLKASSTTSTSSCSLSPAAAACLPTCSLAQYVQDDGSCGECTSCSEGCLEGVSCSLCASSLCSSCEEFKGPCSACPSHYYLSATQTCVMCSAECKECFGPTYLECSECVTGYFLQPYTTSVCLPSCPFGSSSQGTSKCSAVQDSQVSFGLETWQQEVADSRGIFTALKGPDHTSTQDPLPVHSRGFYFDGDSLLTLSPHSKQTEGYRFATSFTILSWFKVLSSTDATLLSVQRDTALQLSFEVTEVGQLALRLKTEGFSSSWLSVEPVSISAKAWYFCGVSSQFIDLIQTDLSFGCKDATYSTTLNFALGFFRSETDDLAQIGKDFVGFIAELSMINEPINPSLFLGLADSIGICTKPSSLPSCLSNCDLSQASEDNCEACDPQCESACEEGLCLLTAGCRRASECSQCDLSCGSCAGFRESLCCQSTETFSVTLEQCVPLPVIELPKTELSGEGRDNLVSYMEKLYLLGMSSTLIGSFMIGDFTVLLQTAVHLELMSFLPLTTTSLNSRLQDTLALTNPVKSLPSINSSPQCSSPTTHAQAEVVPCSNLIRSAQPELLALVVALGVLILGPVAKSLAGGAILAIAVQVGLFILQGVCMNLLFKSALLFNEFPGSSNISGSVLASAVILLYALWACTVLYYANKQAQSPFRVLVFKGVKHSLFPSLYFFLFILYRGALAGVLVAVSGSRLKLLIVCGTALLVRPIQEAVYLAVVRPYRDTSNNIAAVFAAAVYTLQVVFLVLLDYSILTRSAVEISTAVFVTTSVYFALALIVLQAIKATMVIKTHEL
jgi:hypothetical protein